MEEQAAYLRRDSDEVAVRFLGEFGRAVARLPAFPHLGRAWPTQNPALSGLRRLPLAGFALSIFYRPGKTAIEIVRVLHHRRHLPPELQNQ